MHGLNIEHIDCGNLIDLCDWNNFVDNNNGSCFNYLECKSI